jgi:alginate O-acetyltransferase complex protein AlgI
VLFNSIDFAIFLPVVFALYWGLARFGLRWQNMLIVAASYVFYGWWDWRFLSLMAFSTLVDFAIGWLLADEENIRKRKLLLATSVVVNLGLLGFFKYFNFFIDNFVTAFTLLGMPLQVTTLKILLPVGISFYTFQTLSYSIDVYRRQLQPTKNLVAFTAFVSFFPQLVAGPIERASNLLPQFYTPRTFNYHKAVDGMRQILWGLFKKVVIADNCAEYANMIFNNSADYSGATLALGAIMFAFQIYGDFSGYSDIAIGSSRLFGFDLMRNFAFPYFSRDVAEFWRRWHISLSTWFRDYLYVPLGGSRGGMGNKLRNTFIIFLVSGFWHGANWTFIAWGLLHALFFVPLLLTSRNRNNLAPVAMGRALPSLKELMQMLTTFGLVTLAWIFFRADSLTHAVTFIQHLLLGLMRKQAFIQTMDLIHWQMGYALPVMIALCIVLEWNGRTQQHALATLGTKWATPLRWGVYLAIGVLVIALSGKQQEFIYFQF